MNSATADGGISYELYFPPPPNASRVDQLRYQLTTRNVFAVLCHVSLVGLSLYQALSDLLERLEEYVPQRQVDNVLTIMSYLSARAIDDVRNDAETAIGLLAWAEDPRVRWEEAWREAFVHAAGLYGTGRGRALMEATPDFKRISPITRALLERASLESQLRVQAAEERLADLSFADMWPMSVAVVASPMTGTLVRSPARDAADRLQRFLLEYCRAKFGGRWPPLPPPPSSPRHEQQAPSSPPRHHAYAEDEQPSWLTRTVAQALQSHFGALYDYLVNRDIVWDMSEARPSRKWLMVSESGNKAFDADSADLPMHDILIEFDNRQRFPHVPHPYPLVPESIPPQATSPGAASTIGSPSLGSSSSSTGFLKRRGTGELHNPSASTTTTTPTTTHRGAAMERRIQLAYTEATNIYVLGSDFTQSDLVDAFVRFEKTDRIGDVDPSLARRARWVLLYGILQTLASVSVDAPGVRYCEGVPYHLSPQLKGARLPPWSSRKSTTTKHHHHGALTSPTTNKTQQKMEEASHELSHCWLAPQLWTANSSSNNSGSASEEEEEDSRGLGLVKYGDHHHHPPLLPGGLGDEEAVEVLDPRSRMMMLNGFAYPAPPTSTHTTATTDSDAGSSLPWALQSAGSRTPSTTRATTPATTTTVVANNPMSSPMMGGGFTLFPAAAAASSSSHEALRRRESQHSSRCGGKSQLLARAVSSEGEWGPVVSQQQQEEAVESRRVRREMSGASSSDAGSALGGRRRKTRKNIEEMMEERKGSPPRERYGEFELFEASPQGARRTSEDVVAHIIRDFDELGVDDIMP